MRRLVIAGLLAMLLVFAGQVLAQDDVSLPPASWYAWIYGGDNEQLYLVNPDGLQATVLRPTLASEVAGGMRQMLVSRDGRYLVQAFSLEDDRYALLIYDFLTGTTTPILTNPGQEIRLGHLGAASFDADSQTVAITLVEMEPGFSEWSVALIDLETGSLAAQITRAEIIANLTGGSAMLVDALSNVMGTFFPVPTYIDDGGNVHFQVVLGFAGGAPTYPAFSWNPQTNAVTASPYVQSSGQIHLPSGDMIYAITDPALASIEPAGPYEPNNTIVRGTPLGAGMHEQVLYINSDFAHLGPRWALGTQLIAFSKYNTAGDGRWALAQPGSSGPALDLPTNITDLHGFGAGALTVSEVGPMGFDVVLYSALTMGTTIWQGPADTGFPRVLWALPDGESFALDVIALSPLVTVGSTVPDIAVLPGQPATENIVHCEGAPPSIIGLGMRARVTIIDGAALNTRNQPGTGHPIARVLLEGEEFDVISGPACADGFTWWQIRMSDGLVAWAAEGNSDRYFMEPTASG